MIIKMTPQWPLQHSPNLIPAKEERKDKNHARREERERLCTKAKFSAIDRSSNP